MIGQLTRGVKGYDRVNSKESLYHRQGKATSMEVASQDVSPQPINILDFSLNQGSGLILVAKSHQVSTGTWISTGNVE